MMIMVRKTSISRRMGYILLALLSLPLPCSAQWGGFDIDTTLWGHGLPFPDMDDHFDLPGDTSGIGAFSCRFVPTDTASVQSEGTFVTFNGLWIGTTEITQYTWQLVMGPRQWPQAGDSLPATGMSIDEILLFLRRLDTITGIPFRLPTRDEWLFACRGGHLSEGYTYSGSNKMDFVGWYSHNSQGRLHPVAQKIPNESDLFDMHGNAAEIVFYPDSTYRILGGCCIDNDTVCIDPEGLPYPTLPATDNSKLRYVGFRIIADTQRSYMDTGL